MKTSKLILASFILPNEQRPVVMCFNSYEDFNRCRSEQQPAQLTIQEIDLIYYEDDSIEE